jgi:predicted aconitase
MNTFLGIMTLELDKLKITLTEDEISVLSGKQGETLQRVMETVVLYGEALGAEKLVDIEGEGHFVISWSIPGISPPLEMLEELVAAGLKTKYPFTLDPLAPLDFENLDLETDVEERITVMFKNQERYDELLLALGLRDKNAYSCNPYQLEIGNIPKEGTVLAWSESACAIFANSVLGARTNRNGAIMDLLSNIVGKTPYTGLITEEGRRANWLVEIKTKALPAPQLLGAVIGRRVVAGVPYIIGLDHLLVEFTMTEMVDYLQEMGAACATYGAVGLYHIENITPEAIAQGGQLLLANHDVLKITQEELQSELSSYPFLWSDHGARPQRCYIGCPHLSLQQLNWWAENLMKLLDDHNRERLAVDTVLFSAPQILAEFRSSEDTYFRLMRIGVKLSTTCCETIFETGLYTGKPVLTNSNKLRAYTSAMFFPDEILAKILVTGELPGGIGDA